MRIFYTGFRQDRSITVKIKDNSFTDGQTSMDEPGQCNWYSDWPGQRSSPVGVDIFRTLCHTHPPAKWVPALILRGKAAEAWP